MAEFKQGDRIIRVKDHPCIARGTKWTAGTISENGILVAIGNTSYLTKYFKPLLTCKGNRDETNYQ